MPGTPWVTEPGAVLPKASYILPLSWAKVLTRFFAFHSSVALRPFVRMFPGRDEPGGGPFSLRAKAPDQRASRQGRTSHRAESSP